MNVLVIIPTYNEKDNVKTIVEGIMGFDCDILFIDDNSPDGTALEIENIKKTNNKLKLIKRPGKMGLGSAYIEGFTYALNNNYEKIVMMDADLSHPYAKIPELIGANSDYSVGSRYIPGGKIEGWPLYRHLLSKCANLYASTILNIGVNDLTSGFNCMGKRVLEQLDYRNLKGEGYAFLIELKYRVFQKGFKLKEVPITFKEREKGRSKISNKIVWEAFWLVPRLKLFS
ncbi:MAG: polyprenol monophosphomannose synthase [Elusimicrobia bacterium]|nr:polyprenol monophosphomannose synthase [Candidatus Liberimonas magnetica]